MDILQGKYVARESRVRLTCLTTRKRHCQNPNSPVEACPPGILGSPVSEADSEAAVRWSSYNVFHHIFLAKQTSIKDLLLCLLCIRKKCLGVLLSGNTANLPSFYVYLSLPCYLQALGYYNKNKHASNQSEHKHEACSTARLYNSDSHWG